MNYHGYTIYPDGKILGKTRKILKHKISKTGYHWLNLYIKGKHKGMYIHRLLAICYLTNYENKRTVNHIDEDTHNNDLTNLEWATHGEQSAAKTRIRADNTSGITGVCYDKIRDRWAAEFSSYKKRYREFFKTKDEAIIYRKYLEDTYKN